MARHASILACLATLFYKFRLFIMGAGSILDLQYLQRCLSKVFPLTVHVAFLRNGTNTGLYSKYLTKLLATLSLSLTTLSK